MKKPCSATDPLWYKDAIIYELHVRAFADSNADGIGDFQGLISKLDYLQELGVTCLWLLPFFPSPLRDDGYDIADYTSVNPSYGTIEDFQQFLDEAHARNMQVLIELVINHTSDQHPWFQKARRAPKGSPEREMYVWSDTDKLFDGVRIIFTDTEKSNWTWDEVAQQYYWHRFFSHQPDLNFDNPRVMEEVLNAMRFWMDMGVDGLRLDAIPYLIERDGTSCENVPETHVKIKEIRAVMDAEYENRLILAEANMWPADVRPYFGDGDECQMAFHFPLMPRMYMALRQEDRLPITDIMAQTPEIPANCQWGLFLRNHDELTLEMVTDDERDYMYLAYSSDPRMRINVGIRRRLAPLVDNNRRRIELLNSILLSFPGTPIMYYGDEIGMGDNIYLGDRNGVRTPMQWNSDRNAGFSTAVPARLYFPVIMDPIWGYQAINVEAQQSDPSSLLHWTRNMIGLRKLFQVFGRGTLQFLHPENRKVLAYIRAYEGPDGHCETVLCVANLSRFAQPVSLDLANYAGRQPVEMLGYVPFPVIEKRPYPLTLAPYSFFWLELQASAKADGIATENEPAPAPVPAKNNLPAIALEDIFANDGRRQVEKVLPGFLVQQRWFGAKSQRIETVNVRLFEPVLQGVAGVAIVDVTYDKGSPDVYQVAIALATEAEAQALATNSAMSVIGSISLEDNLSLLYDATLSAEFRRALLIEITDADSAANNSFTGTRAESLDASSLGNLATRVGAAEQSNTSILYGNRAILKIFRHLRAGENPDVEIVRFLTQVAGFSATPAYLGDLRLSADGTTLAFLQAFAANEGDGWKWTMERLASFYDAVGNGPAPKDVTQDYLENFSLLGRRTAEMHLALATPTEDTAFSAETFSGADLTAMRVRIERQLDATMHALESSLGTLPKETTERAQELLQSKSRVLAMLGLQQNSEGFGARLRIHGDYHLGQLLRTSKDFLIVDFEGEPARSLEERRRKETPLKDVAGMLRSFSYAARSALDLHLATHPGADASLANSSAAWERAVSENFLQAYLSSMAANPELLPAQQHRDPLLRALLIEKALYELSYELNNRPSWVPIPLDALLALIGSI